MSFVRFDSIDSYDNDVEVNGDFEEDAAKKKTQTEISTMLGRSFHRHFIPDFKRNQTKNPKQIVGISVATEKKVQEFVFMYVQCQANSDMFTLILALGITVRRRRRLRRHMNKKAANYKMFTIRSSTTGQHET